MKKTNTTTPLQPIQPKNQLLKLLFHASYTPISPSSLSSLTYLSTCLRSKIIKKHPIIHFFTPSKASLGLSNQSKLSIHPVWHYVIQTANSTLLSSYEH